MTLEKLTEVVKELARQHNALEARVEVLTASVEELERQKQAAERQEDGQ